MEWINNQCFYNVEMSTILAPSAYHIKSRISISKHFWGINITGVIFVLTAQAKIYLKTYWIWREREREKGRGRNKKATATKEHGKAMVPGEFGEHWTVPSSWKGSSFTVPFSCSRCSWGRSLNEGSQRQDLHGHKELCMSSLLISPVLFFFKMKFIFSQLKITFFSNFISKSCSF